MSTTNEVWISLLVGGSLTPADVTTAIGMEASWLGKQSDPLSVRSCSVPIARGNAEDGTPMLDAAVSKLESVRSGLADLQRRSGRLLIHCDLETFEVWESFLVLRPDLLRSLPISLSQYRCIPPA